MALELGDTIPDISLIGENGKAFKLNKFINIKSIVVYFYPKNFTPGCTKEACEFRDRYEDFKDLNTEVIAISSDSEESHTRFKAYYKLPFIFLSDKDKNARKTFGVKSSLFGLLPGRETFVFDKEGKLLMKYNNLNAAEHTAKAFEKIKLIQNEN